MDDLISRRAAIEAIDRAVTKEAARWSLQELPSAERRGRWEHYEHREPQYDIEGYKTWAEEYQCSNCGFIHTVIEDFGHYAFCPRCGAQMEV